MKLTRRNTLIGLGSLATAGGGLIGTGAFTSVQANRSVNINTAGDGSAQLGLSLDSAVAAGDSDDVIDIEIGSSNGVNLDAVTRFDNVLTVTNNGANQITDINIYEGDGTGGTQLIGSTSESLYFELTDGESNGESISSGSSDQYDLVIDTDGTTQTSNVSLPSSITIEATTA